MQGKHGKVGPAGRTVRKGGSGDDGYDGRPGTDGRKGERGEPGYRGPQGLPGPAVSSTAAVSWHFLLISSLYCIVKQSAIPIIHAVSISLDFCLRKWILE